MRTPTRTNLTLILRGFVAVVVAVASSLAQQGEIIIPSAEIGGSDRKCEAPTPGMWWRNRGGQAWGARDATILMAGKPREQEHKPDSLWQVIPMFRFVPYRVPELVIAPKVKGWYRIHVGLYADEIEVWST